MPRCPNTRPTMIYWLVDTRTNTPFYCGKTVRTPEKRLWDHRAAAAKRPHGKVSACVVECGEFIRVQTIEIVAVEQDWRARERYWIAALRLLNPDCANVSDGGDGSPGWVPGAEWRAKRSAGRQGKKHSPETRAKIGAAQRGRVKSPEMRAKLSLANSGRKQPPEAVAKTAAANRGLKRTLETRAKLSAARQGRIYSPEARAKMRAAKMGTKRSPETRAKIGAALKGKKRGQYAPRAIPVLTYNENDAS